MTCFEEDFEACVAHLVFPVTHRKAIRSTNLLERLFVLTALLHGLGLLMYALLWIFVPVEASTPKPVEVARE